jgi:cellulose biosynthesis protein BcsQ
MNLQKKRKVKSSKNKDDETAVKLPIIVPTDDLNTKFDKAEIILQGALKKVIEEDYRNSSETDKVRTYTRRQAKKILGNPTEAVFNAYLKDPEISEFIKKKNNNNNVYDVEVLWTIMVKFDLWDLEEHSEPRIIPWMGHKGGTGKTTSCINIGMSVGELTLRSSETVIIDMDPQGNSTSNLIKDSHKVAGDDYVSRSHESAISLMLRYMNGEDITSDIINEALKTTGMPNVFLLPANSFFDSESASKITKAYNSIQDLTEEELAAKEKTGFYRIYNEYEYSYYLIFYFAIIKPLSDFKYIFIDCPPQINELTNMITLASSHIIAPLVPSEYELMTAAKLISQTKVLINKHEKLINDGVIPEKDFFFLPLNKQLSKQLSSKISDTLHKHLSNGMYIHDSFDASPAIEKLSSIQATACSVNKNHYKEVIGNNFVGDLNRLETNVTDIAKQILKLVR